MSSSHWKKSCLPLRCYWNEALKKYKWKNPGSRIGKLPFPKLLDEDWMKTAVPIVEVPGLKSTGICPFNPDVLRETASLQAQSQEIPIHYNVNRSKELHKEVIISKDLQFLTKLHSLARH
jgi:hypothetical protein